MVAGFVLSLVLFTLVGVASARYSRAGSSEDYLVASRSVHPWLSALSSVATNNSGFMFVGLIGFAYSAGVQAIWLQAGWVVGDAIVWWRTHRRVRERSGRLGSTSIPSFLATDETGRTDRVIAGVAGALTFFFLAGYAAAQLNAGGTALRGVFGWDLRVGAWIGAAIVLLYSLAGGLRASIWTDAVQAVVMLLAMAALLVGCVQAIPIGELFSRLAAADPALVRWIPSDLTFGFGVYLLGFVFGGLGALGQPHILVRSMAIDSPKSIPRARRVYFAWFVPFSVAAVLVGLYARLLVPELNALAADSAIPAAELALPEIAQRLLPGPLVGVVLAGLFAATMSTADSQLLSCSAAVTQDLVPAWRASAVASKLATATVAALALGVALNATEGVFALVLAAWAALGASLGPLLLLRLARRPVSRSVAIAMMASGLVTVWLWGRLNLGGHAFELLPGLIVPLAVYGGSTLFGPSTREREASELEVRA